MAKNRCLEKQYGLTLNDYRNMLTTQNNMCKICKKSIKEGSAYVDHCHINGNVRGILCNNCNLAIGHLQDNIFIAEELLKYLKENKN